MIVEYQLYLALYVSQILFNEVLQIIILVAAHNDYFIYKGKSLMYLNAQKRIVRRILIIEALEHLLLGVPVETVGRTGYCDNQTSHFLSPKSILENGMCDSLLSSGGNVM